jgi:hypothetical protein
MADGDISEPEAADVEAEAAHKPGGDGLNEEAA